MPDGPAAAFVHISSVIARARPGREADVAAAIARLPGCEVVLVQDGRIIVVIEGQSSGAVGERLTQISLLDGVVTANMVYEQIETLESLGERA